jgi:membrane protein
MGKGLKGLVGGLSAVLVARAVRRVRSKDDEPKSDAQEDGSSSRTAPETSSKEQNTNDSRQPQSAEAGGTKKVVKKLDAYQRSHPWAGFPFACVKKFGEDEAGNLAALISYYTFFSIFPLMLALVTILGFVLGDDPELQRKVVDSALAQFPVIGDQIRDNVGSLSGNWLALVVGLAGALWAGMGAVDAAQNAFNSVWDVPAREKPSFVVRRLRSLVMLVVIGGGLFLTAAGSLASSSVDSLGPLGRLVAPLVSLAVNVGIFMVAFRVLTQRDLTWSDVLPGAVVAGVAAAAFQLVGGFVVDRNLQGASQTYGTFAVVIGLLSWLYLQAQVTLLAAEVNVVRSRRLWPRGLDPEDLTEGDRRALTQHAEMEERVPGQDVRTAVPGESGERGVDRQLVASNANSSPEERTSDV